MRLKKLWVMLVVCGFALLTWVPVMAQDKPVNIINQQETPLTDEEETTETAEEAGKRIITVNHESFNIEEFSSAQLEAVIQLDANTYTLTTTNSNPEVATISDTGVISAITPGQTTITLLVTMNDSTTSYSRTIPVTVYSITGSISFESSEQTVSRGSYFDINYTLSTEALSNHDVIWTSSNPSVATVVNGRVTGVEIGTTQISATIGSIATVMTVYVVVPLKQIEFNPATLELEVGQSVSIPELIYVPYDTTDAKRATYTVDNEEIVSITDGSIRALTIGKTFIYAQVQGIEAVLEINVIPQTAILEAQQLPLSIMRSTDEELVLTVADMATYQGNRFQLILPVETVKNYMDRDGLVRITIICDDYLIRDNWQYFSGMVVEADIMNNVTGDFEIRFVNTKEQVQVMYRFSESYDKSVNLRFTVALVNESNRFYNNLTSPGYSMRFYNTDGFPLGTRFSINPVLTGNSNSKLHILYLVEDGQLVDTQQEVRIDDDNGLLHFSVSENSYVITFTKVGVTTPGSIISLLSIVLGGILIGVGAYYYKRNKHKA